MPSIRTKLTANLLLAAALPLLAAILTLITYGYRQQVKQTGATYHSEAEHVAMNLEAITRRQVGAAHDLLALTDLPQMLAHRTRGLHPADDATIRSIESGWPELSADDEELRAILDNEIAARMRRFQETHPLFAELFVTDKEGRLIAATHKTSDYYQADETWWQKAEELSEWDAWIEGLEFDQSAMVLSLDVSMPVFIDTADGGLELVGVMKAVIDVSPLFASVPFLLSEQEAIREILREDGTVLLRLLDENFMPGGLGLPAKSLEKLKQDHVGWSVEIIEDGNAEMIGIAPLDLFGVSSDTNGDGNADKHFVIVRHDADALLSPLRRQILFIVTAGVLLSVFSVWLGNYFSRKHLLDPLEIIRSAARSVAATADPDQPRPTKTPWHKDDQSTEDMVSQVSGIRTNDELERFSKDFVSMARQLLNYQGQLEADVAAKTAEIQKDLAMARDFQQALLPQRYPPIPHKSGGNDAIALEFHHVYHPAAQLSGDFFDLIKINDHCAGIIVADVMGHGTRSALVTAIFRALLQEATQSADDPGRFLSTLNRAFYSIIRETGQVVFVTAAYLVINTRDGQACCASAGHPSPLRANRVSGLVKPVFKDASNGPALGLYPESEHPPQSWQMHESDLIYLFTDGIVEAADPDGNEYGTERLAASIREQISNKLSTQVNRVVDEAMRFSQPNPIQDDVCLIGVEAISNGGGV